jgi:hypothetical protein
MASELGRRMELKKISLFLIKSFISSETFSKAMSGVIKS